MADLRGNSGWKAEIEAAERLARTGAVPASRLLGLYTDRRPAASGGVWDRVAAVQALDLALNEGATQDLVQALPRAWRAAQDQRLEVIRVSRRKSLKSRYCRSDMKQLPLGWSRLLPINAS